MSETRPSKKQRELLSFIEQFIAQHGYGPSYREIMRGIGYKSVSTVAIHVNNLITKGHLRKRTRSARSLEVVKVVSSSAGAAAVVQSDNGDEKWLLEMINRKFHFVEKAERIEQKAIDELYVLVGALHILGLSEAANNAKSRLLAIKVENAPKPN